MRFRPRAFALLCTGFAGVSLYYAAAGLYVYTALQPAPAQLASRLLFGVADPTGWDLRGWGGSGCAQLRWSLAPTSGALLKSPLGLSIHVSDARIAAESAPMVSLAAGTTLSVAPGSAPLHWVSDSGSAAGAGAVDVYFHTLAVNSWLRTLIATAPGLLQSAVPQNQSATLSGALPVVDPRATASLSVSPLALYPLGFAIEVGATLNAAGALQVSLASNAWPAPPSPCSSSSITETGDAGNYDTLAAAAPMLNISSWFSPTSYAAVISSLLSPPPSLAADVAAAAARLGPREAAVYARLGPWAAHVTPLLTASPSRAWTWALGDLDLNGLLQPDALQLGASVCVLCPASDATAEALMVLDWYALALAGRGDATTSATWPLLASRPLPVTSNIQQQVSGAPRFVDGAVCGVGTQGGAGPLVTLLGAARAQPAGVGTCSADGGSFLGTNLSSILALGLSVGRGDGPLAPAASFFLTTDTALSGVSAGASVYAAALPTLRDAVRTLLLGLYPIPPQGGGSGGDDGESIGAAAGETSSACPPSALRLSLSSPVLPGVLGGGIHPLAAALDGVAVCVPAGTPSLLQLLSSKTYCSSGVGSSNNGSDSACGGAYCSGASFGNATAIVVWASPPLNISATVFSVESRGGEGEGEGGAVGLISDTSGGLTFVPASTAAGTVLPLQLSACGFPCPAQGASSPTASWTAALSLPASSSATRSDWAPPSRAAGVSVTSSINTALLGTAQSAWATGGGGAASTLKTRRLAARHRRVHEDAAEASASGRRPQSLLSSGDSLLRRLRASMLVAVEHRVAGSRLLDGFDALTAAQADRDIDDGRVNSSSEFSQLNMLLRRLQERRRAQSASLSAFGGAPALLANVLGGAARASLLSLVTQPVTAAKDLGTDPCSWIATLELAAAGGGCCGGDSGANINGLSCGAGRALSLVASFSVAPSTLRTLMFSTEGDPLRSGTATLPTLLLRHPRATLWSLNTSGGVRRTGDDGNGSFLWAYNDTFSSLRVELPIAAAVEICAWRMAPLAASGGGAGAADDDTSSGSDDDADLTLGATARLGLRLVISVGREEGLWGVAASAASVATAGGASASGPGSDADATDASRPSGGVNPTVPMLRSFADVIGNGPSISALDAWGSAPSPPGGGAGGSLAALSLSSLVSSILTGTRLRLQLTTHESAVAALAAQAAAEAAAAFAAAGSSSGDAVSTAAAACAASAANASASALPQQPLLWRLVEDLGLEVLRVPPRSDAAGGSASANSGGGDGAAEAAYLLGIPPLGVGALIPSAPLFGASLPSATLPWPAALAPLSPACVAWGAAAAVVAVDDASPITGIGSGPSDLAQCGGLVPGGLFAVVQQLVSDDSVSLSPLSAPFAVETGDPVAAAALLLGSSSDGGALPLAGLATSRLPFDVALASAVATVAAQQVSCGTTASAPQTSNNTLGTGGSPPACAYPITRVSCIDLAALQGSNTSASWNASGLSSVSALASRRQLALWAAVSACAELDSPDASIVWGLALSIPTLYMRLPSVDLGDFAASLQVPYQPSANTGAGVFTSSQQAAGVTLQARVASSWTAQEATLTAKLTLSHLFPLPSLAGPPSGVPAPTVAQRSNPLSRAQLLCALLTGARLDGGALNGVHRGLAFSLPFTRIGLPTSLMLAPSPGSVSSANVTVQMQAAPAPSAAALLVSNPSMADAALSPFVPTPANGTATTPHAPAECLAAVCMRVASTVAPLQSLPAIALDDALSVPFVVHSNLFARVHVFRALVPSIGEGAGLQQPVEQLFAGVLFTNAAPAALRVSALAGLRITAALRHSSGELGALQLGATSPSACTTCCGGGGFPPQPGIGVGGPGVALMRPDLSSSTLAYGPGITASVYPPQWSPASSATGDSDDSPATSGSSGRLSAGQLTVSAVLSPMTCVPTGASNASTSVSSTGAGLAPAPAGDLDGATGSCPVTAFDASGAPQCSSQAPIVLTLRAADVAAAVGFAADDVAAGLALGTMAHISVPLSVLAVMCPSSPGVYGAGNTGACPLLQGIPDLMAATASVAAAFPLLANINGSIATATPVATPSAAASPTSTTAAAAWSLTPSCLATLSACPPGANCTAAALAAADAATATPPSSCSLPAAMVHVTGGVMQVSLGALPPLVIRLGAFGGAAGDQAISVAVIPLMMQQPAGEAPIIRRRGLRAAALAVPVSDGEAAESMDGGGEFERADGRAGRGTARGAHAGSSTQLAEGSKGTTPRRLDQANGSSSGAANTAAAATASSFIKLDYVRVSATPATIALLTILAVGDMVCSLICCWAMRAGKLTACHSARGGWWGGRGGHVTLEEEEQPTDSDHISDGADGDGGVSGAGVPTEEEDDSESARLQQQVPVPTATAPSVKTPIAALTTLRWYFTMGARAPVTVGPGRHTGRTAVTTEEPSRALAGAEGAQCQDRKGQTTTG